MTKPATMHPPVHPVSAAAAVTTVRELAAFDALRPAWDRLHAEDPDAGVFLGFGWLRRLFAENPGDWCVKLLTDPHDPSRLLAALPLRVQLRWSRSQKRFQTHFAAAGRLCFTEYTGFLCARGSEAAALDALIAKYPQYPAVPVLRDPPTLLEFRPVSMRSWCAGAPRSA